MNVLDLFSGIGGFSLGLERAGMRTVAFCEIDPYCRKVLARHWPDVPVLGDIRDVKIQTLAHTEYDGPPSFVQLGGASNQGRLFQSERHRIDVICGGFPCQDISVAGKGAGITGERSGLWKEYARIIGEVRPRYVIVENVAALLHRGLGDVLGDLAALGYDAEWHCIPASAVGAPHRRDRIWIVAYPTRVQSGRQEQRPERQRTGTGSQSIDVADAACELLDGAGTAGQERRRQLADGGIDVSDTDSKSKHAGAVDAEMAGTPQHLADARSSRQPGPWQPVDAFNPAPGFIGQAIELGNGGGSHQWLVEPDVGRVAHGVPSRVDRLRSLGNAVVPQIPELIGRAIMSLQP